MTELYHAGFSTCSQKVRLVLAQKGIHFESHEIDLIAGEQHGEAYVKLNPNHVVPTLIDRGAVLIESTLINEYLEDAYPESPMLSADPAERHAARLWTKRLDQTVHPATGVITFAIGPRAMLLEQPAEVREANIQAIPDPVRRAARRSVIDHGVQAPEFAGALHVMVKLLDDMEDALGSGDWLSGPAFGLADAALLPYVLRLDQVAMTSLIESRPRLCGWYKRATALEIYRIAVADWLLEPIVEMFRARGEASWGEVESLLHA